MRSTYTVASLLEVGDVSLAEKCTHDCLKPARSIHTVHDDAKDKDFELEMTWISPKSGWQHQLVPKELAEEAERKAKEQIDAANEMEE